MESLGPLAVSAVAATLTVRVLTSAHVLYKVPPFTLGSAWEMIPYVALGLISGVLAPIFLQSLRQAERFFVSLRLPLVVRLMLGGAAVGVLAINVPQVCGNGYSVVVQILNGQLLWFTLLGIFACKWLATMSSFGSGAPGGVFTPSLFMGASVGYLFGTAANHIWPAAAHDPRAFALVGMGTFYGGLAHVPIGSLVMTCELAGSYDLLVPLMLAEGIAYVALRNKTLYHAQVQTKRDSPAHRDDLILDFLKGIRVDAIMIRDRPLATFLRNTSATEVIRVVANADFQDAFPVLGDQGELVGVITAEILRTTAGDPDVMRVALADDMMGAPISIRESDDLHNALDLMIAHAMRELLVVDEDGKVIGVLDQTEITVAYLAATARAGT